MEEIGGYRIFNKNCGNDSSFIAFISISISVLSFSLFSRTIEGTVNVHSFDFFLIKLICWFIFGVSISMYYYNIKMLK